MSPKSMFKRAGSATGGELEEGNSDETIGADGADGPSGRGEESESTNLVVPPQNRIWSMGDQMGRSMGGAIEADSDDDEADGFDKGGN